MTNPNPAGGVVPLMAYPQPVPLPPGYGALVVSVNRGPYLVTATATARLKVDRQTVAIPSEGTWHVPVPAGTHDVRYTDFLGIPAITTPPQMIHPGQPHYLNFDFGVWRNRVRDGQGTDVTKFGMWSNYSIMLITLGALLVFCCGGTAVIGAFSGSGS